MHECAGVVGRELLREFDGLIDRDGGRHLVVEEHFPDADAHDRLICLSTGKDFDDPKRMRYTKQEWLKTTAEMNQIFADHPEVLTNTLEIADKVEFR